VSRGQFDQWGQGRATIERLLAGGHIEMVPFNAPHVALLLANSQQNMESVDLINPDRR
jgi:hypothetical protein